MIKNELLVKKTFEIKRQKKENAAHFYKRIGLGINNVYFEFMQKHNFVPQTQQAFTDWYLQNMMQVKADPTEGFESAHEEYMCYSVTKFEKKIAKFRVVRNILERKGKMMLAMRYDSKTNDPKQAVVLRCQIFKVPDPLK